LKYQNSRNTNNSKIIPATIVPHLTLRTRLHIQNKRTNIFNPGNSMLAVSNTETDSISFIPNASQTCEPIVISSTRCFYLPAISNLVFSRGFFIWWWNRQHFVHTQCLADLWTNCDLSTTFLSTYYFEFGIFARFLHMMMKYCMCRYAFSYSTTNNKYSSLTNDEESQAFAT
jgi:hypothetical protein